ncbi:MAG: spore germination protein [Defluviitaleaceae bacterium]|nr:spore germination protein [Defluviitaleaceae bacterium]MCL2189766.1 spore germination protein [Defluviitaleaceae bacterium]MCL2275398.1 spore germination protein [Defluviitaleaceae bacterium]
MENKNAFKISPHIKENMRHIEALFTDSQDFIGRHFPIGGENAPWVYMAYFDAMSDRELFDLTIVRHLHEMDWNALPAEERAQGIYEAIKKRGIATADFSEADNMEDVLYFIMAGDTALFLEDSTKVIILATRGFPNRGIQSAETEVVVQGPREAFSEVMRFNTALIRRRIRDTGLKVKQSKLGKRSQTDIALMYIEGIVRPEVLAEVERRLEKIDIDGVMDAGCVEQLIEESWLSPFPQIQLTERPDKAASSLLEGRIAIIVDCSPFVLLVPVALNTFFQASEDYYSRWQVMSITRYLRFVGAFIAVALPGLYIATALYHPSMIPLQMVEKLATASRAVLFPAVMEIILLDAAFELLREAGIRLRNASGGTIGIVGGLIVGQAAVEAGLVSPIVVIIVAMTGIATFAIPSVSLVYAFRLIKYFILILAAALGFIGLWAGLLIVLIHLAGMRSFGFPYLMPFAAGEMNNYEELKDSIFRLPLSRMRRRPFYANPEQNVRLK